MSTPGQPPSATPPPSASTPGGRDPAVLVLPLIAPGTIFSVPGRSMPIDHEGAGAPTATGQYPAASKVRILCSKGADRR